MEMFNSTRFLGFWLLRIFDLDNIAFSGIDAVGMVCFYQKKKTAQRVD